MSFVDDCSFFCSIASLLADSGPCGPTLIQPCSARHLASSFDSSSIVHHCFRE